MPRRLTNRSALFEVDILDALKSSGIPGKSANRAYHFAKFAWEQHLLQGPGIRFSPDYMCFDGAENVVETGRLADEPFFAAAMRLAPD